MPPRAEQKLKKGTTFTVVQKPILEVHKELLEGGLPPFSAMRVHEALEQSDGNALFIDLFFPPISPSIGEDARSTLSGLYESVLNRVVRRAVQANYAWRRPAEFLGSKAKVQVFEGGVQAGDVLQGQLGNCWFLCALAALCEFPALVDRLFGSAWAKDEASAIARASDFSLYEMRLCVNGEWLSVLMDDLFPCVAHEGGGPAFSRCHGAEIWVLLVEKAYAKLHGSYYNLRLGSPLDGLVDLTGAPCVAYEIAELTFDDFWSWDRNDCLVCASTPGEDTVSEGGDRSGKTGPLANKGLLPGHAYTVIQARRIRHGAYKGAEVLQVRNPWGEFEWQGAWSDASKEFAACKAELDEDAISGAGDDGVFWMGWADFKARFVSIDVCAPYVLQPGCTLNVVSKLVSLPSVAGLTPSVGASAARYVPLRLERTDDQRGVWHEARAKSYFGQVSPDGARKRLSAAHCMLVTVAPTAERHSPDELAQMDAVRKAQSAREHVNLLCTLHQRDARNALSSNGLVDVGMAMYKLDPEGTPNASALQEVGWAPPKAARNISLEAHVGAGTYLLVPLTAGVAPALPESRERGTTPAADSLLSPAVLGALRQLVYTYDADLDGHLGRADLTRPRAAAFVAAAKIDLAPSTKAPLAEGKLIKLAAYEPTGLSTEHLAFALHEAWGATGGQWAELFKAVGYESYSARPAAGADVPFVFALHSSQRVEMRAIELPYDVAEQTLAAAVRAHGEPTSLGAKGAKTSAALHALKTGSGSIFCATNAFPRTLHLTLNCSGSNVHTGGALKESVTLPPAGTDGAEWPPTFVMGLTAIKPSEAYTWQYAVNARGATDNDPPVSATPLDLAATYRNLMTHVPTPTAECKTQVAASATPGEPPKVRLGIDMQVNDPRVRLKLPTLPPLPKAPRVLPGSLPLPGWKNPAPAAPDGKPTPTPTPQADEPPAEEPLNFSHAANMDGEMVKDPFLELMEYFGCLAVSRKAPP